MEKDHIAKKQKTDQQRSTNEEKRKKLFITMDAYSRHKLLVNEYMLNHSGATRKLQRNNLNDRTDYDVLKEHHKFLWEDDVEPESWEKRLAKKYYDRLFKEYCITDLSYYRQNKIALRWRTEKEVLDGKGQFCCAEKKCSVSDNLKSWEVNFSYSEHGENKNALVKLRLCAPCSEKLNFREKRREAKTIAKCSEQEENTTSTVASCSLTRSDENQREESTMNNESYSKQSASPDIDSFLSDLLV